MIVVGITGHLGTGKSTVAAMFAQAGAAVINADLLAHHGMRPGGACFKRIVRAFGRQILVQGQIDRKKLGAIVFSPKAGRRVKLKKLEAMIHPFVIRETQKQLRSLKKAGKRIVILDVPLLFESGMDHFADLTLVVKTNARVQLRRCSRQRRLSPLEARQRMRFQLPLAEKIRRADLVIDNNGTIHATRKQVKDIGNMIQRRYLKTTQQ